MDLSDSLFAVKISKTKAAKVSRGIDYFAGEIAVESHFGEGGVDDWAVDESEIGWG